MQQVCFLSLSRWLGQSKLDSACKLGTAVLRGVLANVAGVPSSGMLAVLDFVHIFGLAACFSWSPQ